MLTLGSDVLIRGPIAGRLHEILIQSANTKDLDFHRDDNPQSDALIMPDPIDAQYLSPEWALPRTDATPMTPSGEWD